MGLKFHALQLDPNISPRSTALAPTLLPLGAMNQLPSPLLRFLSLGVFINPFPSNNDMIQIHHLLFLVCQIRIIHI